ncbi:MAG: hypothetical protein RL701_8001, partial [Pseudomonadota bacterium]
RTVQPGLKIVLISGSFETSENFDAVLLKPFDTDQFLQVVAGLLDRPSVTALTR